MARSPKQTKQSPEMTSGLCFVCSEGVDLGAVGHGRGGAGAGDGDSGDGAGKLCGFDEVHAFGQGGGEAAVEGVACTSGFDDGASVDGGDVAGGGVGFCGGCPSAERSG